jgi:hypothetical protein
LAHGSRAPTVEVLIRDEVTAALERERARLRAAAGSNDLFGGLQAGFANLETGIQSLARTIGREFGTLARLTGASGFLGAGLIAGIDKAGQALSGLARASEQNRYLADQLGLTTAQLSNMTARGQALGMTAEQSRAGITSLANSLRELKMRGQDAAVYKALDAAGGASGRGFGDQLLAAVRGPGGYEAGVRKFATLMAGMNSDAQRKLAEIFNLGSLTFRDLYSPAANDLPNILDLVGPQARRLNVAMASLNISFDNLKTTLGGALMPAFEEAARTFDQFLQGPGSRLVQQFADWASTLKIPWDDIAKGLVGAIEALIAIFAWGKRTVGDLEKHVGKVDTWGPILKKLAHAAIPGFINHLMAFAKALSTLGKHKDTVAKIAAAIRGDGGAAGTGTPLLPMPQPSQLKSRRTGQADNNQIPATAQPVPFMSGGSGYHIPAGYTGEQDDADELTAQVKATQQQVGRLANYISEQAFTTDASGAGGLAGLAGQIRARGGGGGGGTGTGGGGGRRGGGGGGGRDSVPDVGTTATGTTAGVTPEGMALLDTIATWEAEPAFDKQGNRTGWNTMVGNVRFDPNTDEHPHKAYPWMRGYLGPAGRSYASGRYQETTATYYENVARSKRLHPGMKVTGWSPEAQNIRNWDKAQDIYARRYRSLGVPGLTGNLQKDLEANKNNPALIGRMSRALSGEWTTAPGGHEGSKQTGRSESQYANQYTKMLARTSRDPALAGNTAPAQPGQPAQPPPGQSPIVWSNQNDIDDLKQQEWERDHLPPGGYTPIPGTSGGRIKLNLNVRGRNAKVSSESSGAMGAANVSRDKSDPSGGVEGFSPG